MQDRVQDFDDVSGRDATDAPATLTYASVVGRETARIAVMLTALNDLEVKAVKKKMCT